jgi:hypothetical protein
MWPPRIEPSQKAAAATGCGWIWRAEEDSRSRAKHKTRQAKSNWQPKHRVGMDARRWEGGPWIRWIGGEFGRRQIGKMGIQIGIKAAEGASWKASDQSRIQSHSVENGNTNFRVIYYC